MTRYTVQQLLYIDSVGGNAHQSAVDIIGTLDANNAQLRASEERLRAELQEAGELAEEAVGYVSPYFRDKWNMDERLRNVRCALRWTETT